MLKKRKLTITTVVLLALITTSTLYYKNILNKDTILDKSYAFVDNKSFIDKKLEELKEKMYREDHSFESANYKISYKDIDEEKKSAIIILTYVINSEIETNKTYTAIIENNEISDVYTSTSKSTEENDLLEKVNNFNQVLKEKTLLDNYHNLFRYNKILNKDKSINQNSFITEVSRYEEKYYYNYDTNILSYNLDVYNDDKEEIVIEIK
ncbi:MAG: hypothetical protein OSJ65_04880 [Bacilli bacterium]|nr:hypothetical protein [Bacilli bacterium]